MKVALCSASAAKYAVMTWHYSRKMPVGKMVRYGIWDDGEFVGVILFSRGANMNAGVAYDCSPTEICELTRVAIKTGHKFQVSKALSIAVRLLKKSSPGLKMVLSYADQEQGHAGTIYQASNWVYVGESSRSTVYWHDGEWKHQRTLTYGFGRPVAHAIDVSALKKRKTLPKHKYLLPLNKIARRQLSVLSKEYPTCGTQVAGHKVPPCDDVRLDRAAPVKAD